MTLLYADLPERPEPPAERSRVELMLGVVATVGAATVGARVVGDVFGSAGAPRRSHREYAGAETVAGFVGLERVVGPDQAVLRLDDVPIVEYAPISADDDARSVVDSAPLPAPLPSTGTPPKSLPVAPAPTESAPKPPAPTTSTTVPASTVPATTVPSTNPTTSVPPTTAPTTTTSPTTTAPPADVEPPDEIRSLALVAGFNLTSQMAGTIDAVGFEGWVDMQLDPSTTPDPVVDAVVADFDLLDADPEHLRANGLGPAALSQTRWAGFARTLVGERQVVETVVSLWREFFAVRAPEADLVELEQVIRKHALGGYAVLLDAVVGSAATRSAFALPAEPSVEQIVDSNLARTVLERFAYGDPERFDEVAIDRAAAALADDPLGFVTVLVAEPAVVSNISGLLARRLLGDGVGADALTAAEAAFASSGGSVRAVVRRLLLDGVGLADPSRIRSGTGWLTAGLRSLGADVMIGGPWDPADPGSLPGLLRLLDAEPGTGVIRSDEDWLAPTVVTGRWQIARSLTGEELSDVSLPAVDLPAVASARELVDVIAESCDAVLSEAERAAVLHYLSLDPTQPAPVLVGSEIADVRGLILSFPSFQRRDGGGQ